MSPGMARSSPQSRTKAHRMSVAYDVLRLPRFPGPIRAALLAVLGLVLLPYVLTPLYVVVEPVSTVMIWRRIVGEPVVRTYVPLSRISPSLQLAAIIAEDGRFCEHSGIDLQGLQAALDDADNIEDMRGGSTITQQVAKNLFLWNSRSYIRKALEFPLALWIDLILSKRRILEIYLNVAEWGPSGQFGVEAGAEYAFRKPARDLTRYQAALLAAILPNPHDRSARHPGPGLRRLAGLYEARSARSPQAAACVRGR
jgi:monofunctional biosynthetic peptidoglycan transglycosylase